MTLSISITFARLHYRNIAEFDVVICNENELRSDLITTAQERLAEMSDIPNSLKGHLY